MIPDGGFEILIRKEERLKIKEPSIQAKLEKEQNEEVDIKADIKEIKKHAYSKGSTKAKLIPGKRQTW